MGQDTDKRQPTCWRNREIEKVRKLQRTEIDCAKVF